MIKFSKEKVLLLHKLIAEETGGSIGVMSRIQQMVLAAVG